MKVFLLFIGILVLVGIFVRRFQILERGRSSLAVLGKWRTSLYSLMPDRHHPRHGHDLSDMTIQEMIPDTGAVDPKNALKAATLLKRVDAFFTKGDLRNAEKTLIQVISLDASNQDAYNKLGMMYLKQDQFSKAEMIYRKLIMAKPDEASYFSNLGLSLYQQNKLAEARSFYEKALQIDQSRPGRFFSLGKILHEMSEFEQALSHFQKAIEMEPRNLDYLLTLAQFYIDRDMPGEARKILGEILAMFPDHETAQQMMGKITS